MISRRSARLAVVGTTIVLLVAISLGLYVIRHPQARVVDESGARGGWEVIEYDGVRVDIPADWVRSDMGDCEFEFEHWGAPGVPECGRGGGVAFYASATFDPAHGPGVRRSRPGGSDGSIWGGYTNAGAIAVYASDGQRRVVERILRSVK